MRELINGEVLGRTAVVRQKKEDPQSLWYFFSILGRKAGQTRMEPSGRKAVRAKCFPDITSITMSLHCP